MQTQPPIIRTLAADIPDPDANWHDEDKCIAREGDEVTVLTEKENGMFLVQTLDGKHSFFVEPEEGQSIVEFSVILALLGAVIFGAWLGASTIAHALNPLLLALGLD